MLFPGVFAIFQNIDYEKCETSGGDGFLEPDVVLQTFKFISEKMDQDRTTACVEFQEAHQQLKLLYTTAQSLVRLARESDLLNNGISIKALNGSYETLDAAKEASYEADHWHTAQVRKRLMHPNHWTALKARTGLDDAAIAEKCGENFSRFHLHAEMKLFHFYGHQPPPKPLTDNMHQWIRTPGGGYEIPAQLLHRHRDYQPVIRFIGTSGLSDGCTQYFLRRNGYQNVGCTGIYDPRWIAPGWWWGSAAGEGWGRGHTATVGNLVMTLQTHIWEECGRISFQSGMGERWAVLPKQTPNTLNPRDRAEVVRAHPSEDPKFSEDTKPLLDPSSGTLAGDLINGTSVIPSADADTPLTMKIDESSDDGFICIPEEKMKSGTASCNVSATDLGTSGEIGTAEAKTLTRDIADKMPTEFDHMVLHITLGQETDIIQVKDLTGSGRADWDKLLAYLPGDDPDGLVFDTGKDVLVFQGLSISVKNGRQLNAALRYFLNEGKSNIHAEIRDRVR